MVILVWGVMTASQSSREESPKDRDPTARRSEKGVTAQARPMTQQLILDWPATDRTDAKLEIDGRPRVIANLADRQAPDLLKLPVTAGLHKVWIVRRGFEPFEQTVAVERGQDARVRVQLLAGPEVTVAETPQPRPNPEREVEPEPTEMGAEKPKQQAPPSKLTADQRAQLQEAARLNAQVVTLLKAGRAREALPLATRALGIRERILGKETPHYAQSLSNLGAIYQKLGESAKAEPLYVQARDIQKKVLGEEHLDYATSLNNLAWLYGDMDEYAKAEPLLVQARDIRNKVLGEQHPHYAQSLNNLATVYNEMGDYAKAEALFVQALGIRKKALGEEHPSYATSLNNLAAIYYHMGDYAKAEPLAQAGMDVETTFANKVIAFLPEATAMRLRESLPGHALLLSILRRMPKHSDRAAYAALWRTRGLVFRSLAARRQGREQSPEAKTLWARLRTTAQQLAQLTLAVPKPDQREARHRRLAELNDEKQRLEAELARTSVEFRRNQEITAAEPEDLVRLLQRDEAVVELLRVADWSWPPGGRGKPVFEWHYDGFVLRRGSDAQAVKVAWVQLGPAKPIDRAVSRWRAAITGDSTVASEAPQAAAEVRRRIWDKIEPHLAGCSQVIVVPDGYLCFLPWAALPGRKPGTCLLEDYAIATAPSAYQLYAMLTEPQSAQGKLLLVGGVAYDAEPSGSAGGGELLASDLGASGRTRGPAMKTKSHWERLPGSEEEVEAIARGWSGGPTPVVLRGAGASERALREQFPGSRYIHLATHGFFADPEFRSMFGQDEQAEQLFGGPGMVTAKRARVTVRNPLILSGVVLAGANLPPKTDKLGLPTGEDGIMTAEEIAGLDLRDTELAVLSACDTGLGNVASGEGVMGLTRAFHLAGTRNVVASLWKLDDAATVAMMKLFYYKLWKEKKKPIEALRESQLYLLRNPAQIDAIAKARGFGLDRPLTTPDGGTRTSSTTADPRLWAAWILSGPGD